MFFEVNLTKIIITYIMIINNMVDIWSLLFMKTIKQLADELGVSKDKVKYQIRKLPDLPGEFTYFKNKVTYLTPKGVEVITYNILGNLPSSKIELASELPSSELKDENLSKVIVLLEKELEIKNKQIEDLSTALVASQKAAATAQALHAGTMQKQLQEAEVEKEEVEIMEEKPNFWQRFFGGKE